MLASVGVLRLAKPLAVLLALAPPAAGRAADGLALWAEAGGGADTNPARAPGAAQAARGFTSLLGRARVRISGEAGEASLGLTGAGRLYPGAHGADALASRLELTARAGLGGGLSATAAGSASDYRERDRLLDRHALRAEAAVALERGSLDAALAGGWALFAPREPSLRPFRSDGPEGWLRGGWSPVERHRLSAGFGLSRAGFPGWGGLGAPGAPTRTDGALHLAADWAWRGPALASVGWAYTRNRSDAPGGGFERHRLTASAALRLPLQLTLAASLALQWTRYPDPLLLAAQQRLAEGQESLDALEGRLTRAVAGPLEASLSLAWYHAQGGAGVPGYERAVATMGLGWRVPSSGR